MNEKSFFTRPKSIVRERASECTGEHSLFSRRSRRSILSYGSAGSILSIGSAGSILSIGSAGSILSVFSAGSILSVFSVGSLLCVLGYRAICNRQRLRKPMAQRRSAP